MKLQRILLEAQSENLMKKLEAMAANGELTTDQINTLTHSLKTALRKHQTSKRSPESYKTAAEKAKATRAQNAKDIDSNIKAGEEVLKRKSKAEEERRSQGLLPSQLSSRSRNLEKVLPDLRKYYDQGPSQDGTTVRYSLRAEYLDTPVDNAEDYWNQSSSTTNETDTNSIKMKKQINEIKRMQQLAGLIKEGMSIGTQGNLQVDYKFKIGQTVESYGNEIIHKILDTRPNWEAVEEDPNDPEFIMKNTEYNLSDENMYNPWYLVEPINKEEDGDYMFWWPEDELELV